MHYPKLTLAVFSLPTALALPLVASAPTNVNVDYCQDLNTDVNSVLAKQWTGANFTGGVAGQKKGLVATGADSDALINYANSDPSQIQWFGNYFSGAPSSLSKSIEFVPQMYGLGSEEYWNQNALTAEKNGWDYFFSFGEPGTPNPDRYQDPPTAAKNYMTWINNYTDVVKVGAPGCLEGINDFKWDQQFLCQCQDLGCNIDFLAVHWFAGAGPDAETQFANFTLTIENYMNVARGKAIWVDNVWTSGTIQEQMDFMDLAVPWLENNNAVIRYGWVSQDASSGEGFVDSSGTITDLGKHYLTAH